MRKHKAKVLVMIQHPDMTIEKLRTSPEVASLILRGASQGSRPYCVQVFAPRTQTLLGAVDVAGKVYLNEIGRWL